MTAADPESPCITIEPVLAAYALGEHDEAIRATVTAHLATCPDCRMTLAAHQATARLIGLGAADAMPRAALRAQVIDAVDAAARHAARPAAAVQRMPRGVRWWPALAGLALAVLLIWNLALQRNLADMRATQQQQVALAALLQNPALERYPMVFDHPLPNAQAHLALVRDQTVAALTVSGMPRLPADRAYQLWLVRDGVRANGGTFTVDGAGNAVLVIKAAHPLATYQIAGVTIEPRGGSSGPTTPRVMGCKLT